MISGYHPLHDVVVPGEIATEGNRDTPGGEEVLEGDLAVRPAPPRPSLVSGLLEV